ncbi:MAG: right-handed parallel beta-helix repeat-containing protein [bacterium]
MKTVWLLWGCLLLQAGFVLAQPIAIDDIQVYDPLDGTPISPYLGQIVEVEGVVFVVRGTYDNGTHYLLGTTAGLKVFEPTAPTLDYGDRVTLTGTVGVIGGEIYLKNAAVGSIVLGGLPTPVATPLGDLVTPPDYERVGDFVYCLGRVASLEAPDIHLHDNAGDTIRVTIDPDTGIDISGVAVGDSLRIFSPVTKLMGEILLMPRRQSDVVNLSSPNIYVVQPDGSGDYPTIQAAVDSVQPFDIIELADGLYSGAENSNIDLRGKPLIIRSQSQDPALCVMDCQSQKGDQQRGFHFHGQLDGFAVLSGVTIRNGTADYGGALLCEPPDSLGTKYTGPSIENCVFEANSATITGGAIFAGSVGHSVGYDLTVTGAEFYHNDASVCGGAVAVGSSTNFGFTSCRFQGNSAPGGGAIHYQQYSIEAWFTGCDFDSNWATERGGVMTSGSDNSVVFTDCTFTRNNAPSGGVTFSGGAPPMRAGSSRQSEDSFVDCVFSGNSATSGGVLYNQLLSYPEFDNCRFRTNSAVDGGVAYFIGDNSQATFTSCTLDSNSALNGGAIHAADNQAPPQYAQMPEFYNCTFAANQAAVGGSFFCSNLNGFPILENSIVAFGLEGGAFYSSASEIPTFVCCDVFGNAGGDWTGDLAGLLGTSGNISEDPLFCDLETGEFTLLLGSPCLPPGASGCGLVGALGEGCPAAAPIIERITDVGGDQGGQLRLVWNRSIYDEPGSAVTITGYSVYRREDAFKGKTSPAPVVPGVAGDSGRLVGWDFLSTLPARGDSLYQYVAATLCDSTAAGGICWSVFMISAITPDPFQYFDAPADSGYSVDNLAPATPTGFSVYYHHDGNEISWANNVEADFDYYAIYRDSNEGFVPSPDNLVHTTTLTEWLDDVTDPWDHNYRISATDRAGNESDTALPDELIGVPAARIPSFYALHQNHPNPFNPSTTIRYDLPRPCRVTLSIFDLSGRQVKVLKQGEQEGAGAWSVVWRGRDTAGRQVASGAYFYRLEAGKFVETRRMILLK